MKTVCNVLLLTMLFFVCSCPVQSGKQAATSGTTPDPFDGLADTICRRSPHRGPTQANLLWSKSYPPAVQARDIVALADGSFLLSQQLDLFSAEGNLKPSSPLAYAVDGKLIKLSEKGELVKQIKAPGNWFEELKVLADGSFMRYSTDGGMGSIAPDWSKSTNHNKCLVELYTAAGVLEDSSELKGEALGLLGISSNGNCWLAQEIERHPNSAGSASMSLKVEAVNLSGSAAEQSHVIEFDSLAEFCFLDEKGRIYTFSATERSNELFCHQLGGAMLWKAEIPENFGTYYQSLVLVADTDQVYFTAEETTSHPETADQGGAEYRDDLPSEKMQMLLCLDAGGKKLWHHTFPKISYLALAEDGYAVLSVEQHLAGRESSKYEDGVIPDFIQAIAADGQLLWRYELNAFESPGSLLLDAAGTAYVTTNKDRVLALDKSGAKLWEAPLTFHSADRMCINKSGILCVAGNDSACAFSD